MTYLEIPMIIALVMVLGVPQIINTSNEGKQIYANRIGYITQEYKSDKQFMDFKNLKKDTKELVDEGYRFLDFSNSPVATYYYSQLPPASKFLTMTAAAQPTTQRFIINELKILQLFGVAQGSDTGIISQTQYVITSFQIT
jgi:hypothetical protein